MSAIRILATAALLATTAGLPVSANASEGGVRGAYTSTAAFSRVSMPSHSWCLHDFGDNSIDCSYSSRLQCAATAAGGLGECSLNRQLSSRSL